MSVDINNSMLTEKALDYAMLSDLAYATWRKVGNEWVPDAKYAKLWSIMKTKGYSVVASQPDQSDMSKGATGTPTTTGYSGTIFEYQGKKILANRGTNDAIDTSIADEEIALGQAPAEQYSSMINFITANNLSAGQ
jgi:hypothetical protein